MMTRNSLSVVNVAYRENLNWRDLDVNQLEHQLLTPLQGTNPVEMGMPEEIDLLKSRLTDTDFYPELFQKAFPDEPISYTNIAKAIGVFQRTIIAGNSAYDRHLQGQEDALSESARRGMELFFGTRLKCGRCHNGLFLDRPTDEEGNFLARHGYFNIGLYNVDGRGSYPPAEIGLAAVTGKEEDMGVFRVPSLRNVMLTGPYAHDGTVAEVDHLLTAYARGGRNVESGPYVGDGALNPYKSDLISGFEFSEQDRKDLLEFLESLTDETTETAEHLKNPFCETGPNEEALNAPCKVRFEME